MIASDSRILRDNAIQKFNQGAEYYNRHTQYDEKRKGYIVFYSGLQDLIKYVKIQKDQSLNMKVQEYLKQQLNEAEYYQSQLEKMKKKNNQGPIPENQKLNEKPNQLVTSQKNNLSFIKNGSVGQKEECLSNMEETIIAANPNVSWDDIAGLQGAKAALKEAVVLPIKFPNIFVGNLKPWRGILLYGPPGTGKTQLAKACATECKATFFSVSASDLISKWSGESEKRIKILFQIAREQKPSIIFIDQIDSMAGNRQEGEAQSSRRVKTEFLVQMEGIGNSMDGVLVLGATNLPQAIDPAMRRRFQQRIMIDLPDEKSRKLLIKNLLKNTDHCINQKQFESLGKQTEGFSGSDLSALVRDAAFESLRICQNAQFFKQIVKEDNVQFCPCGQKEPSAIQMTLNDLQSGELVLNPVTIDDFNKALERTKPTVSKKDLEKYHEFTKKFGQAS